MKSNQKIKQLVCISFLILNACLGADTSKGRPPYSAAVNEQAEQLISICGFSPVSYMVKNPDSLLANSTHDLASASCPTREQVYCPATFGDLSGETKFCEVSRPWGTGYWWHCAPQEMDLCEPDSCQESTSTITQPFTAAWSDHCTGFKNSMLAYETPATIENEVNKVSDIVGDAYVNTTTAGSIQYFYYQTKDSQYVSFRGTNSICNILADVYAAFVKDPDLNLNFHSGFLLPSQEAFKDLSDRISKVKTKKLYVSGHSLGGAVAAIFSLLVAQQQLAPLERITTVGQPEVTDKEGVSEIEKKYIASGRYPLLRIINGYDIVPYAVKNVTSNSGHFGPELRIGWPTSGTTNLMTDFSYYNKQGGAGYQRPAWYYSSSIVYDHLGTGYGPPMIEMGCPSFVFLAPKSQIQPARNIQLTTN